MTAPDLKPCPFCGCQPWHSQPAVRVVCKCGAAGEWGYDSSDAAEKWNTRTDLVPDARDIRAAALREAVKALRDWQDNLILCGYKEAPVTVGMAADVVLALIDKEPTK